MNRRGHLAQELVYDAEKLQKAWAFEHGIQYSQENWVTEIIIAQLQHIKPDVVFFQDIHSLSYEIRSQLKRLIPSIKKIVIFRGFPGVNVNLAKELSTADLLLVGSPHLLKWGQENGLSPHLVYHAFDVSILNKIQPSKMRTDFSFIGSSGFGYGEGHKDRFWMLVDLIKQTDISLWIDEPTLLPPKQWRDRSRATLKKIMESVFEKCPTLLLRTTPSLSDKVQRLIDKELRYRTNGERRISKKPLHLLFPDRCHASLFGLNMFQTLCDSKVVLNKHSNPALGAVDNMRLFQATGIGTCLLTDTGSNMSDLFEDNKEVVTYSSTEECIEKASYLLKHEKERQQIAAAGQKRTLTQHTSAQRCEQIDELIQNLL